MRKSSDARCEFCAFLRDLIIRARIVPAEGHGRITIHLWYEWDGFHADHAKLRMDHFAHVANILQENFQQDDDDQQNQIGSDDGGPLTDWLLASRC